MLAESSLTIMFSTKLFLVFFKFSVGWKSGKLHHDVWNTAINIQCISCTLPDQGKTGFHTIPIYETCLFVNGITFCCDFVFFRFLIMKPFPSALGFIKLLKLDFYSQLTYPYMNIMILVKIHFYSAVFEHSNFHLLLFQ